jgi:hypothetical protein
MVLQGYSQRHIHYTVDLNIAVQTECIFLNYICAMLFQVENNAPFLYTHLNTTKLPHPKDIYSINCHNFDDTGVSAST